VVQELQPALSNIKWSESRNASYPIPIYEESPDCFSIDKDTLTLHEAAFNDVDSIIMIMAALVELEVKDVYLEVSGNASSQYWIMHDLIHVTQCKVFAYPDNPEHLEVSFAVNSYEEDEANLGGALLALNQGVSLITIIDALSGIERGYYKRFDLESKAKVDFLNSIKIKAKLDPRAPACADFQELLFK